MATVFATLKDVSATPGAPATVVFTWDTDRSVQLRVRLWDASKEDTPANSYTATESAAAVGRRSLNVTLGAPIGPSPGKTLNYEIVSITAQPPTLRPQQGSVRMPGARTTALKNAVPVRFYAMDGPMIAPPPAEGVAGNVLNYTWAQYNPLGTDETAALAAIDPWVTVSDLRPEPTSTGCVIYFTLDKDVSGGLYVRFWPLSEPTNVGVYGTGGDVEAPHLVGSNSVALTIGAGHEGETYGYEIVIDWQIGVRLRATAGGVFQLTGARAASPFDVPVRFYAFSSDMRAAVPALGTRGNWNRYAWSQYNPKGT